ncbi:hypothetical protein SSS_03385 [Sarcoptes scabiei]|nr:hypothetical protein SSS_03385 [Sarcoptes scabiei]
MADLRILLLAMLFGTGSWIAMTGLWLEMPLFIQKLPEGWSLASHMNIMIQLANIGPFLYWILEKRYKMVNDINAIHLQMWLGIVSCLFLIGFWNRTSELFGQQKSIFLLIFTFFLAFTDCTSSVTFLPFMARFSSSYLPAYLVGEGLSSFLPSLTALIQGSGHSNHRNDCLDVKKINETESRINFTNSSLIIDSDESTTIDNPMIIKPRFSIEIFLCSLLLTLSISYGAFLGLRFFSFARKEQQTHQERINQHNLREIANTSRLKRKTRMSEDLNSDVETRPPVIDVEIFTIIFIR